MRIRFSNFEDPISNLYQLSSNLTIPSRFGKHLPTALFCDFLFAPVDTKNVLKNVRVNTASIGIAGEGNSFGQDQLIAALAREIILKKKGFLCGLS